MEINVKNASVDLGTGKISFSVDVKEFDIDSSNWYDIEKEIAEKLGCKDMEIVIKKINKFMKMED